MSCENSQMCDLEIETVSSTTSLSPQLEEQETSFYPQSQHAILA